MGAERNAVKQIAGFFEGDCFEGAYKGMIVFLAYR